MIYYITFGDTYSGIYQSQVVDVINYLNDIGNKKIRLISFIPLQNFSNNKLKIIESYSNVKVYPIFAGITRWRLCRVFIHLLSDKKTAICRGPIAFELATQLFNKVVYDGRAAVKAEVQEYDVVVGNKKLAVDFIEAEKRAVLASDYRIAVSNQLVKHWRKEFQYTEEKQVVIPCTLTSQDSVVLSENSNNKNEIKIVYSGGTGGWQSFEKVVSLFKEALKNYSNLKILFLTRENGFIDTLIREFPTRCERKWINHKLVVAELSNCDYGILIREENITNQVASPVKFAEYLNAGLKVLISENLGDYTTFVKENDCGIVVDNCIPKLEKATNLEKEKMKELCNANFLKTAEKNHKSYLTLLNNL